MLSEFEWPTASHLKFPCQGCDEQASPDSPVLTCRAPGLCFLDLLTDARQQVSIWKAAGDQRTLDCTWLHRRREYLCLSLFNVFLQKIDLSWEGDMKMIKILNNHSYNVLSFLILLLSLWHSTGDEVPKAGTGRPAPSGSSGGSRQRCARTPLSLPPCCSSDTVLKPKSLPSFPSLKLDCKFLVMLDFPLRFLSGFRLSIPCPHF